MDQESNTGSSSNASGKPKLSLKKKSAPASAETPAPAVPEAEAPAKPIRMSFKRPTESTGELVPQAEPVPSPEPPPEPAPEPVAAEEAPRKKLGLKRSDEAAESPDASPEPETIPPQAEPEPAQEATGTTPDNAVAKRKLGLKRQDSAEAPVPPIDIATVPPVVPPTAPPPPPPVPGLTKPSSSAAPPPLPSGAGAPPPPAAPKPPPVFPGTPPPAAATEEPDLIGQELDRRGKTGHTKSVLIGIIGLLILVGGVAAVWVGLQGALGGKDDAPTVAPPAAEASAPLPPPPAKTEAPSLAQLPKAAIDRARSTTEQVSEKASIEPIVDTPPPPPALSAKTEPAPVPAEITTAQSPVPSAPVTATRDPDVIEWIETMGPISFGRGRMLYRDQVFMLGDRINDTPAIWWTGQDQALGLLLFKDANGLVYEKDY